MSTGRVFARAVGICNIVNAVKQKRYSDFLPNVSLRGARMRGPIPNMHTKPVWQAITSFSEAFRDSAICFIPGANMLLANGLRTTRLSAQNGKTKTCDLLAMLAMIAMLDSFFHLDQARGFDGSSFENSMSCIRRQTSRSRETPKHSTHLSVILTSIFFILQEWRSLI
jgi:hypothetical protein